MLYLVVCHLQENRSVWRVPDHRAAHMARRHDPRDEELPVTEKSVRCIIHHADSADGADRQAFSTSDNPARQSCCCKTNPPLPRCHHYPPTTTKNKNTVKSAHLVSHPPTPLGSVLTPVDPHTPSPYAPLSQPLTHKHGYIQFRTPQHSTTLSPVALPSERHPPCR